MGNYLSLPILALAAVLQSSVIPQIRFLGGGPDLVFLCVLAWAIHARLEEAVTWALVGGIIQDLLSATATGTSAVGLVLIVFGVCQIAGQFHRVGFLLIVGMVLVGSLVQQLTLMLLLPLTGFQIDPIRDFGYVVLPTVLYNLVFIWPVYGFIRRVQRRFASNRRFFS
jgi:rod shape-determining protein MreD